MTMEYINTSGQEKYWFQNFIPYAQHILKYVLKVTYGSKHIDIAWISVCALLFAENDVYIYMYILYDMSARPLCSFRLTHWGGVNRYQIGF